MDKTLKKKTMSGFVWRVLQQISAQFVNFVISVVLARILLPEDYGIIALTTVFISLCNVVINTGFSSAVVQKKELSQLEMSSVFYISVFVSIFLYFVLWFCAPFISTYYDEPLIVNVLRVQSLTMIFAAISSVPNSLLHRELQFKKTFLISFFGAIIHGIAGVYLALNGYGVWALIVPSVVSHCFTCVLYFITSKWFPSLSFKLSRIKTMFSFSIKILMSNIVNTIYKNIQSLIVGKRYSKDALGYYNKGAQFPMLIMTCIDTSMNTVLFSTLSKIQDEESKSLLILRRSMKTSMYVCAPVMIGLAVIAKTMVHVLLTDKWLPCVPFVQIMSIICLTYPMAARLQAINAIGKSSITLFINLVTNIFAVCVMLISTRFSVTVFALANLFASIVEVIITTMVSSKVLNYKAKEFVYDIIPSLLCSCVMGVIVYLISLIHGNAILIMSLQIAMGAVVYIVLSYVFKLESFFYLLSVLKGVLKK